MKQFVTILIAVLLVFGAALSWNRQPASAEDQAAAPAAEVPAAESEAEEPAAAPEIPEVHGLDYDALRALHEDGETVMTLAGETASWKQFYTWLHANGLQVEDYFRQMAAYYQVAADWSGSAGGGRSFAKAVVDQTKDDLMSMLLIRAYAGEKGITLSEEELADLTPDALAAAALGEGATGEQLREALETQLHMDMDDYVASAETSALFRKCYQELFGADGEKLSEEEIVSWLEEQGYLSAHHILLMTIDPTTGKPLDEEAVAQKKEQARKLAEELCAIEDHEELLRRFTELKEQYCEDGGKVGYPDGYTFTPGTMVTEFEDAVRALESYGVSEPVESTYGLHIIMRLPLSGDSLLYSTQGTPSTARVQLAAMRFTEAMDGYLTEHPVEYAEGVEDLDLTQYVKAE